MDQYEWQKVNDIVDTALDLDGEERDTFVEEKCAGDQTLKSEVTQLLEAIEQSDTENFLEGVEAFPENLAADFSKEEKITSSLVGETIDQYTVTELIGHGGMGSVFLAKRADEAYDRRIALKILRQGMDTPSNIARFKRERNILANLDHPNIARLLDGGVTDAGLPYLVMEYVDGIPLVRYCDKHRLSLEQRLSLFKDVCKAVQHAHKNAVIHRDLKPSNILVTEEEKVKVLDFGIAKLLEPEEPDSALLQTRTGARMLTLGYAAPEQLESKPITTATDSYTLGILLYELLLGVHPFDMDDKDLTEIEQIIRNEAPEQPSQKLGTLTADLQEKLARHRSTTAAALSKQLEGDLDAIIMKALRKESNARYNSAEQLLEDLTRCEQNLPVIAREDTFRYNTSKFIRRNKTGLSVAAGFLILLISFTAFYTWQIAEERNKAQLEAEKAQQVSSFLTNMFQASNPTFNPKDTVTAATFLKRGEERITQLNDQPEIQANLLSIIAKAHSELGRLDQAEPLLKKNLKLRKKTFGASSFEYAEGISQWGIHQRQLGNFSKAESLHRAALSIKQKTVGENDPETATSLNDLGLILDQQGKYKEADSLYKKALKIQQQNLEPGNLGLAELYNNRAGVLRKMEKTDKAEELFRKALNIWQKNYGDIHPAVSSGYNDLGIVLHDQGNFKEADSLFKKSISIDKKLYGESHADIAQSYNNIGLLYGQNGNLEKAEPYLTDALEMRKEILEDGHPRLAESLNNLGSLYVKKDEYDKAQPLLEEALKIDKAAFGPRHPYVAIDLTNLARIARSKGSFSKAEKYYKTSLSIFKEALPPTHSRIYSILTELGNLLHTQNKNAEAATYMRKALEFRQDKFGAEDWRTAYSKSALGKYLIATQNFNESEKLLKDSLKLLKEKKGRDAQQTQQARKYLVELYTAWDKPELAEKYSTET